jgi:choline-sulfatase
VPITENGFLHVNYWDAHTPYRAPAEFGNPFKDEPLPAWLTPEVLEQHQDTIGPHGARQLNMYYNKTNPRYPRYLGELKTMEDLHAFIDGYDCGIRYMDTHIGLIMQALKEQGVYDDLAVIISSDHGENLGELGIYGEHGTADGITPHIPMIIKWPGVKGNQEDSGLHYNLDLAPTLAELLGIRPSAKWDGQSYAKTLLEGADCGREYLVLSQCAHVCQRAVRFDNWIYTRTYHDGYHLFPNEMLYDLENDPHEQVNLASDRKDICQAAVYKLTEWHDDMMSSMPDAIDPLWTVMREGGPLHARGHLRAYARFLRATGREHAVELLKERHPGEQVD